MLNAVVAFELSVCPTSAAGVNTNLAIETVYDIVLPVSRCSCDL